VFLGYDEITGVKIIIKEINNPRNKKENDFSILRKLRHPGLPEIIDAFELNKSLYIVMNYISGNNLGELVKLHGTFDEPGALDIVLEILDALDYLHSVRPKPVIHGDIKPENILLKGNGRGTLIPKIADFGLSREFSKAGGSVLTEVRTALGTILYMPPEQIRDAHSVRETADLYSMGMTLYYLLTSKYPFNFPTPLEVRQFLNENRHKVKTPEEAFRIMMEVMKLKTPHLIVLTENPIPIQKRVPQIPPELAKIVDKAIKKDISQRFQSATDFKRELESVVSNL